MLKKTLKKKLVGLKEQRLLFCLFPLRCPSARNGSSTAPVGAAQQPSEQVSSEMSTSSA